MERNKNESPRRFGEIFISKDKTQAHDTSYNHGCIKNLILTFSKKYDTICIIIKTEVKKMYNTHVKAVRDLRNNYSEVSKIIKNQDHVIITNNGKSESVLIPYEHLEDYQDYLHTLYINEKLAEAEAGENNPDNRLTIEEVMKNWDEWEAKKK